jgi:uncharacterized membrane protein HdeD (DUF308 family)
MARPADRPTRRCPWPLSSTTLLVLLIGIALVFNGIAELIRARAGWPTIAGAAGLSAAGVVVLVFRGFTTNVLAIIIAVVPIIFGVLRIVDALRPGAQEKAASLIFALAAIIAGLIALAGRT